MRKHTTKAHRKPSGLCPYLGLVEGMARWVTGRTKAVLGSGERRRRRAARRRGRRSSGGTWKGRIVSKVPAMGRGAARWVWLVQMNRRRRHASSYRRASAGVQSLGLFSVGKAIRTPTAPTTR